MIHSSKSAGISVDAGQFSLWMSDGTAEGYGADGDIILKTKRADGNQDTKILIKHAPEAYTVTNVTVADRTYDADSTSVAELADILGTLISDLQNRGIVG